MTSRLLDEGRCRFLICVLCSLGIAWLSLSNPADVPGSDIRHLDKIGHFGVYGVYLVAITWAAAKIRGGAVSVRRRAVLASLWCFAYGTTMEMLQLHVTTNREFSLGDIVADVLGAVVFAWAYVAVVEREATQA